MTHADLINLWPSLAAFADEIGAQYETAKAMRRRGSIPSGYWVRVVEAARSRGLDEVSFERLAELVAMPVEAAE